jgi:adenylate kinase family enzyme
MKKKLVIINGTMGVGKTTVCKELYQKLEKAVWLDGDWCWMMHPWDFREENKTMVIDNITYQLRNFLKNNSFDYIIFSWVIHQESIFDLILNRLQGLEFETYKITITCSEGALRSRMLKDDRDDYGIEESIRRLRLYQSMNTIKVDTTAMTVSEATERIRKIII